VLERRSDLAAALGQLKQAAAIASRGGSLSSGSFFANSTWPF
jgi:hypothetical protein